MEYEIADITENFGVQTYLFDDLPADVQDSLIEENRDVLVDDEEEWYQPVYQGICEEAEKYGISLEYGDISFSGFWSQGDGASFVCPESRINTYTLLRKGRFDEKFPELKDEAVFDEICGSIDLEIRRIEHRYSHKNTVTSHGSIYMYDEKLEKLADEVLCEAEMYLDKVKDKLCDRLYTRLEKYYDELRSDESVAEALRGRFDFYYADGICTRGSAKSITKLANMMSEEQQEKFIALMEQELQRTEQRAHTNSATR